jgi:hypothetical protein
MKCRAVVVEALVHVGAKLQMVLEKLYLAIMRCCVEGHSSSPSLLFECRPTQHPLSLPLDGYLQSPRIQKEKKEKKSRGKSGHVCRNLE